MTDTEIIKALECCGIKGQYVCEEDCPRMNNGIKTISMCRRDLILSALDLINRQKAELNQYAEEQHELMIEKDKLFDIAEKQKAEIERLKKGINIELENYATEYDNKIKAEAVKEFAERLKEELRHFVVNPQDIAEVIDNLLKETVGEKDG